MCEREPTNQSELDADHIVGESPTEPAIYEHLPLNHSWDEIRLIKLRKEREGPLRCKIQIFPLNNAPRYIALSYRWGPPSPLHNLLVGNKALKIRDILNSCLLELREDVDTWLWIDQICIAQGDTTERNHQVGMMSRLYSNSASVIVWIGDIPLAAPGNVDRFTDQNLDSASAVALLNNSYFTRLWIVQEVLLAKTVKIHLNGNRCVTWRRLYDAYLSAVPGSIIPTASSYLLNNPIHEGDRSALAWTTCINGFSANACEDLRDKVYGMMGVVREEDKLTVDYQKSVLEVYTDVFSNMWDLGGPMHPNHMAGHLRTLGSQMGIELSLIASFELVLHHRYEQSLQDRVSAIRFKKADDVDKYDHWWYECDGKRLYFCPSLM